MQVRVIALGCAADLLKDARAKQAAAAEQDFVPTLLQALQARVCMPPCSVMQTLLMRKPEKMLICGVQGICRAPAQRQHAVHVADVCLIQRQGVRRSAGHLALPSLRM